MPILHIVSDRKNNICGYFSINGEREQALREGCYFLPDDLRLLEYHTIPLRKRTRAHWGTIDRDIHFTLDYDALPEHCIIEFHVYPEGKRIPYGPGYREYVASENEYSLWKAKAENMRRTLRLEELKKAQKREARRREKAE